MESKAPLDLQETLVSLELLDLQASKATEGFQEHLVASDPLVPPALKVLQASLERRETPVMLLQ